MDPQTELNVYYSILIAIGTIFVFAVAVILFFIKYRNGLYKQQVIIEHQESEHRLELLKATLEVTEMERKRISEELHDAIGSHLAVAKMALNTLSSNNTYATELQNLIDSSKQTINDTIHTVREISHDLYPPGLAQFGFKATISDLFEKLSKSNAIQFNLICEYPFKPEDKTLQLVLYRVTQELATNTLKYANATQVNLKLMVSDKQLNVYYTDNGKGMLLNENTHPKGLGLLNIESRLKAIGATFEFKSSPNKGFEIDIKIPIHE